MNKWRDQLSENEINDIKKIIMTSKSGQYFKDSF